MPTSSAGFRPSSFTLLVGVAFMAIVSAAPSAAQLPVTDRDASPALAALEAASGRYASASSLCADFRQVLSIPLLDRRREGRGRLCQRDPNLFSMRFTDPEGDLIVVDGEHAWVYQPSQDPKQVIKAPLSFTRDGSGLDFHREFLEETEARYEVGYGGVEELDGGEADRVLLKPRRATDYDEAVVWIDRESHLVRKVEIREENGSVRSLRLSNVTLDPTIPDGTFSFTPPPDAVVITP